MSRGLFYAAISQSGNALCPWAFVANPKSVAKRLSYSIGCPTKNPRYLVACLMNKEPNEIVAAQHDLSGWEDDPIVPFAPSIEDSKKVAGDLGTVFLPDHPLVMWESGNFNKVPWITGVNDQEGSTLYSAGQHTRIEDELSDINVHVENLTKFSYIFSHFKQHGTHRRVQPKLESYCPILPLIHRSITRP